MLGGLDWVHGVCRGVKITFIFCLHKTGNGSCLLNSKAVRLDSKRTEIRGRSTMPQYFKKIVQP